MIINLKFCGGCNPRYNRGSIAKKLMADYPQHEIRVNEQAPADVAVALCGCSASCVKSTITPGTVATFVMYELSHYVDLCALLDSTKEN